MSMLRRPLTQLELCEDDLKWMVEEMKKREDIARLGKSQDEEPNEEMEVSGDEANKSDVGEFVQNLSTVKEEVEPVLMATTPQQGNTGDMNTPVNAGPTMPPPPNVRITRAQARHNRNSGGTRQAPSMPNFSSTSTPSSNPSAEVVRFETLIETPEVAEGGTSSTSSSTSSSSTSSSSSSSSSGQSMPTNRNSQKTPERSESPDSPNAHLFNTPSTSTDQFSRGPSANTRSAQKHS